MKHLFSFRQRPNETLTHSTTRGLNGSRMVVETTVKGRSNDCRPTLGRLSTLFLLLFALSFGFNQEAKAIGFKQGNIFFDATGITDMKSYTYFAVGHDSYNSCYLLTKVNHTNYYKGWCSNNGNWWDGCNFFTVFSATSSWTSGKGYDDIKQYCGGYYAGKYTSSYNIDNTNIYELTPSGTSKGASFTINYRSGISALNTTQTVTVQLSTDGGSSYSNATKGLASVSATTYYFGDNWSADQPGSISLTSGSSTVSGSTTAAKTSTVSLSVSNVATGYTFVGWYYSNGTLISTNTTASYVPKENKTVYARFNENQYSITATADPAAGGTVTPTTATAMGQISGGSITATPKTGYHFVNWTLGTATGTFGSSTTASTTFKPTQAGTVVANFAENTHNITISNDGNGSTTPSGAQSNVGEVTGISITATPNTNFAFKEWDYTGGTITSQTATTTFKPTADNATIRATFQSTAVYYDLTVGVCSSQSAAQGTVSSSPDAGTQIQGGTAFTLTAHPATGYEVEGWYNNADCTGDKLQPGGDTYSFSLSANTTVYVKFKEKTFSVTVQAGTGIDQVTGGGAAVGQLTGTNISATVKSGYTWSTWTGGTGTYANGATVKDNTFRPTAASTLTATATENKYNVTINTNLPAGASLKFGSTPKAWGSVANVGIDSKQAITVTLNAGYKYDGAFSVTGGARVSGGGSSFTVWADGADGTITVNIAEDLSSDWKIQWHKDDKWTAEPMLHSAPNSKDVICIVEIESTDIDKDFAFKIQGDSHWYGWGTNGDDKYTYTQTATHDMYDNSGNDHDLHFKPTIAGTYTFKVEDINAGTKNLTVTWPIYNCVYGEFNSWSKDANKLEFGGGDEASTVVNITDISKSYQFLVLVNSNYLTNNASFTTPITRSTASNVAFAAKGGSDNNAKFTPDIVGNYTFTYNKSTNKLTITYPALPTASTTATEKRIFNESELSFISGNGTEANPYKIYTDEALTIDITALAAQTNLTAKYQFGEDAATTDVLTKTITNPSIEETSILIKAFYESDGVAGTAWEKTIWYQGVATPTLHLTASWTEAQEGDEVPENVTIYYSASNYSGPAIVTRSKDGAEAETFFTVPNGTTQKNQTYNLPDKNIQRQTFVATATANGRTFTATKAVSIYRLVEITITDASHLMDHYYMWENGTNPLHEEKAWPGNNFFSKLGNAHIFYVKYPSYTHFVLNNGKNWGDEGAAQTIDVAVPDHSTCYTIGEKITTEGDNQGKDTVEVDAQCPNKLYVGDIDPVSAVQGEGVMVSPQVDIDPLLNENDLTISFNYGSTQGITCDQRGRSFMVTATAGTGTYDIQVTYSIPGADPVTKPVTINVTSAIMIQAKYGNLGWSDHNVIYIHYWGTNINATQKMTWKDYVGEEPNKQDRVYARIPLGSDDKINFQIYAWNMDEGWHITKDVTGVTSAGCYIITPDPKCENGCKRNINREGENCWTAYYVEIDMNNGTVYRSNTVEDLNNAVSFFAPGSSESQAKAGAVRIICNGTQTAVVPAATFTESGIYTAKITANGEGLSDVAPYTGDYYIRTDAAEGGWNDYVKDSHKFTYFTPYEGALYDYYWVMNKKVNNQGDKLNIKGCVGNDINENLANMIESSNYTDGYGDIIPDAGTGVNLRFGYNPETNYFERSILRGSTQGESDFLNIVGNNIFNDQSCNKELNEANYKDNPEWSKFGDISNWVYEKNIYVEIDGSHPRAQALLKSKAFNGTTIYQLGYEFDNFGRQTGTPAQRDILGLGTTRGTYNLRIIYDFKTNRIVSAWSPVGDVTYSTPTTIEADVLFVRHEDTPVAQVKLDNDAALVSELNSAYFVMEIDGASQKLGESMYWFSVPFDCEISSIFGVEGYVTLDGNGNPTAGTWGIQEYDGETRAQKGWYIEDTQTFWRWKHKSEKLLKGNGYILVFDRTEANNQNLWKEITREEPCEGGEGCVDGKKTVTTTILRLYFPSSESGWDMTRSGKAEWVDYEDWTCEKKDRKAQDSNWRLLGTNSYSNIRIDKETQFERKDDDEMLDRAPNFVYVYDRSQPPYNRYEPATSVGKDFLSFNCYMVQFSGRINWNQYTQSEPEVPTSVAARRVVAENELTNAQMTLSLKKGNNTEDNTYIYMDTRATTDFDNQMDLTKITDTRANHIYSVINEVEYAGNTLPVEDQIVPLTVNINTNGAYTFAMPEMTDGLEVYLMDNATNAHIDMAIDSYTVDLNKGKIADRFYLDVRVKERTTPTIIETIGTDGNPTGDRFIKVIQNDQLHIIRNGRIYNASGMELNR